MTEYIKREAAIDMFGDAPMWQGYYEPYPWEVHCAIVGIVKLLKEEISKIPAADVAPVVRCKDCKHSTLPSELTQRYGKPGTLTCHNMHAPSNRRNVGSNDFCSYGERKEND